ncbi:anaphase-promoting complex subunit 15 [Condylostylus longicornis]|uniref:anaphase-promoting complex subunit 15 n=1 Tax=Condylostylus longicornis TaxID=2530218 RepID=UPI00244DB8E1|nr:anaphase-promoting complex subunit 15 [Condylostylus longicornis]
MPMIPFFPSLKPHTANHIWFDIDEPCNEDAEVLALERENTNEVNAISSLGQDLNPIGKALTMVGGPETDDEDANDDTDDSDSHDDEDDEIDRLMDSVNNRTPMEDDAGNNSNNDDDVSTLILQHSI